MCHKNPQRLEGNQSKTKTLQNCVHILWDISIIILGNAPGIRKLVQRHASKLEIWKLEIFGAAPYSQIVQDGVSCRDICSHSDDQVRVLGPIQYKEFVLPL